MNPIFPKIPENGILQSQRLELVPPSRDSFEEIFDIFTKNHSQLQQHFPDTPYDAPSTLGWIDDQDHYANKQQRYSWMAIDKETRQIVGHIGIYQIAPKNKANPNTAQLRYWVDKDQQRKGIASEMINTVTQALSPTKLELHILQSNKPSQRLAQKLGGSWTGQLENDGCLVEMYQLEHSASFAH